VQVFVVVINPLQEVSGPKISARFNDGQAKISHNPTFISKVSMGAKSDL
jgi:hypothetical protein